MNGFTTQDDGDGQGSANAAASWGTYEAADTPTSFEDDTTYVAKLGREGDQVRTTTNGLPVGSRVAVPSLHFRTTCLCKRSLSNGLLA